MVGRVWRARLLAGGLVGSLASALGGCVAIPEVDLLVPDAAVVDARPVDAAPSDAGFAVPDLEPDGPPPECRAPEDCTAGGGVPGVAVSRCEAGICGIESCAPNRVDLDGIASTGCEYPCTFAPGLDECDGRDGDCDGRVDEDAAICDCAERCVGERAESICDGDVCRIASCAAGAYNADGRAEGGCACDVASLMPGETIIEFEPVPEAAMVHFPGDGRPGFVAWTEGGQGYTVLARAIDADGYPIGVSTTVATFARPVEVLAVSSLGELPAVAARAVEGDATLWAGEGGAIDELVPHCLPTLCRPTVTSDGIVAARIVDEGETSRLRLHHGAVVASWQPGVAEPDPVLWALACLDRDRCIAIVRRGMARLVGSGFNRPHDEATAGALAAAGDHWIAAIGFPNRLTIERLQPGEAVHSVDFPLDAPTGFEALRVVPEPDGGATIFAQAGAAGWLRVAADLTVIEGSELAPADFLGEGRIGDGRYHDHLPRALAGDALVWSGLPRGAPDLDAVITTVRLGDRPLAIYSGPDGLHALPAGPASARPTVLLRRDAARAARPAAAVIGDRLVVAEPGGDRLRLAASADGEAASAVERWSLPLSTPLVTDQTVAALLPGADGPGLVVVIGERPDDGGRVIGGARLDAPMLAVETPSERMENAPILAGPGAPAGGLLATVIDPGEGLALLIRTVDGDGQLSPPIERARTFTAGHDLSFAPETGRYTLAWLDRTRLACGANRPTAVRALQLDAAGRPLGDLRELPLTHECPRAVRLAPAPGGGTHVIVASEQNRVSLLHLDPTGHPLAPPSPDVRSADLDESLAAARAPDGPLALWLRTDRLMRLTFACPEP